MGDPQDHGAGRQGQQDHVQPDPAQGHHPGDLQGGQDTAEEHEHHIAPTPAEHDTPHNQDHQHHRKQGLRGPGRKLVEQGGEIPDPAQMIRHVVLLQHALDLGKQGGQRRRTAVRPGDDKEQPHLLAAQGADGQGTEPVGAGLGLQGVGDLLLGEEIQAGQIENERVDDAVAGDKLLILLPVRIIGRLPHGQRIIHPALQGSDTAHQGQADKQQQGERPVPAQGRGKITEKALHGLRSVFLEKGAGPGGDAFHAG